MITIKFIDNQGGGSVDTVEVRDGTTIAELFAFKKGAGSEPGKFNIRLNNELCHARDRLMNGDMVSITPLDLKSFLQ